MKGYDTFHTLDKEGRGVCLYVKNDLKPTQINIKDSFAESVFVKCQTNKEETATFGLIYRSPSSTKEENKTLNATILKAAELQNDHLVIIGDFNYPDIDWINERSMVVKNTKHQNSTKQQKTPSSYNTR